MKQRHPDDPTCDAEACLGEAFDLLVRLNRLRASDSDEEAEQEARALRRWCARSAAHAQAWREAMALWQLLLPAACGIAASRAARRRSPARLPLIASASNDIRVAEESAASDTYPTHFHCRQSWS
ncbi:MULTISPECIES: hypothetical protein [unclassified Variovorax]|jgi:ferric-dicitrate binding protein FerR (iron transport regulator)|uniref:hypothetical protein n=1 Tax=unclassified Variovorax TaxID=663243 RepID=UPI000F7E97E8|nr:MULTISPECIES: hypothetical protein [unclassified Variovorax]RSZ45655.1 hypothetical protein EJO70_04120 [Variovorax sp. 553]RSZ46890.1 hypothetical protein EJO71_07190 [Variovorax sp. 679]